MSSTPQKDVSHTTATPQLNVSQTLANPQPFSSTFQPNRYETGVQSWTAKHVQRDGSRIEAVFALGVRYWAEGPPVAAADPRKGCRGGPWNPDAWRLAGPY
jgi:hypothetical protein